jgi:hypothetical protein
VFGIGGTSKVDIIVSKFTEPPTEVYGDIDRDQYFRSSMGVAGASYSHSFNASTFAKLTLSGSFSKSWAIHDLVHRKADLSRQGLQRNLGYTFKQGVGSLNGYVNHKLSARHTLNAGFFADRYQFNFVDSVLNENTNQFENRFDYRGSSYLIQPYVQSKYRITENLV